MAKEMRLSVSAVIERDNEYLFVKNEKSGLWSLASGKIEFRESPEHALVRECRQEIGTYVDVNNLVGVYQFVSMNKNWITDFVYACTLKGEPRIVRPREISEIAWLSLDDLHKLRIKGELRSGKAQTNPIEDYISGKSYPLGIIRKSRNR